VIIEYLILEFGTEGGFPYRRCDLPDFIHQRGRILERIPLLKDLQVTVSHHIDENRPLVVGRKVIGEVT